VVYEEDVELLLWTSKFSIAIYNNEETNDGYIYNARSYFQLCGIESYSSFQK